MTQKPFPFPGDKTIFPPWDFSSWNAVDDRVRGGSSVSHLEPIKVSLDEDEKRKTVTAARFWGTLDIETLGGAGFASQRHLFGPLPLHLSPLEYHGVHLSLHPDTSLSSSTSHPNTFTLVLKTTLNTTPPPKDPKTPPTPEPASLSYEATFSSSTSFSGDRVSIEWRDFTPMYRGRQVKAGDPMYKPLSTDSVYEISLMCRSGFGDQKGEFGAIVLGIAAWAKASAQEEGGRGAWSWLTGLWGWVGGWWSGTDEGKLRLEENVSREGDGRYRSNL